MHECTKEGELKLMQENVTEIKGDVKILLKFQARILGITAFVVGGVGLVCSLAVVFLNYIKMKHGN